MVGVSLFNEDNAARDASGVPGADAIRHAGRPAPDDTIGG
jgi:hypothetical protein